MKYLFLLFVLLFGLAWGIVQGMVMVQPGDARAVKRWFGEYRPEGVRNHVWFGLYHLICAVMMLLGLAAAMSWDGWFHPPPGTSAGVVRALTWTLGCAALGWEASELGYSWARWAKWLPDREHLTALDSWSRAIEGSLVKFLHAARLAAGVGLLTVGGML